MKYYLYLATPKVVQPLHRLLGKVVQPLHRLFPKVVQPLHRLFRHLATIQNIDDAPIFGRKIRGAPS